MHAKEGALRECIALPRPNTSNIAYECNDKQAISARKRALCQLTVCFEFQSRSDRRTQKLCPANGIQK